MTSDRSLTLAAYGLIAGFVIHNSDHARRGLDVVQEGVIWAGTLVMAMAAVVVTLILTRHRLAAAAAMVGGWSIAIGVSAAHLVPDWGPLSDALPGGDVHAITWIAVLAEIVAAAWLGWVGFQALRDNRFQIATREVAL